MKLEVLVPGRTGYSFYVNADDTIRDLKVVIKSWPPMRLKGVNADEVVLFAAKTNDGTFLSVNSEQMTALVQGDTRAVESMMTRELELDADALVGNVFADAERNYLHVLVMATVQRIECVLVGVQDAAFSVFVDITGSMEKLRDTIAKEAQIPNEGIQLFLAKGQDDEWLNYWTNVTSAPDRDALQRGETTPRIDFMMRDEGEIRDVYVLAAAPRGARINILVTSPALRMLRRRSRHWDPLLSRLNRPNLINPAYLARAEWNHISDLCRTKVYTQAHVSVDDSVINAVMQEVAEARALPVNLTRRNSYFSPF